MKTHGFSIALLASSFIMLFLGFTFRLVNSRSLPPVVLEAGAAEIRAEDRDSPCGLVCVALVTRLLGRAHTLESVRTVLSSAPDGSNSMKELIAALHSLGFWAIGIETSTSHLRQIPRSLLILHVNDNHFVVGIPVGDAFIVVSDPPKRPRKIRLTELSGEWRGHALLVCNTKDELHASMNKLGLAATSDD